MPPLVSSSLELPPAQGCLRSSSAERLGLVPAAIAVVAEAVVATVPVLTGFKFVAIAALTVFVAVLQQPRRIVRGCSETR